MTSVEGTEFTPIIRPWARREARAARLAERHPARRTDQPLKPRHVAAQPFSAELRAGTFDPRGYFVYLLFGDDLDVPFYVGQSRNILGRLGTHAANHRGRISGVQLIRCDTVKEMLGVEAELIARHQPEENLRGVVPQRRGDR